MDRATVTFWALVVLLWGCAAWFAVQVQARESTLGSAAQAPAGTAALPAPAASGASAPAPGKPAP